MLEFRILGPLEVVRDGEPIRSGGRKQRTLLAYLVLHANETVSNRQLVDALWGDEPPNTATKTIHVYVSQVRRTLEGGEASDAPLVTEGAGYALRIPQDRIDLVRFEATLKRARADAERGAVEDAAAGLRAALAMWRGPALGELSDEPGLRTEAARLDEMRRAAMEELFDLELALGRQAELIGELRSFVREDPLRERPRAQLMLALYQQGRQADALELYEQTRRLLSDELGIDPGRDLQALHEQILRQDPALDPPRRRGHPLPPRAVRGGPSGQRRASSRWRVIAARAVAAVAALSAVAFWAWPRESFVLGQVTVDTLAILDPRTGRVVGRLDLGAPITEIAFGYGSVWVTSDIDGTVSRIDPASRSVRQTIRVGSGASGIAFADGAVWITLAGARSLARIDPDTNEVVQRAFTGNAPTDVAFAAGHLWTTDRLDGTVSQIDPVSATRIRTITVGTSPVAIAGNDDALWVADSLGGSVVRIEATTGSVVARVNVGNDPSAIAVSEAVWVTNAHDGTLSKISPASNAVLSTVSVGGNPSDVAVADGIVWVATDLAGGVVRVDATEAVVRDRLPTQNRPVSVAISSDVVWAGILPSPQVHRGGTLRVVSPFRLNSLDPASGPVVDFTLQHLIYDSLVGLKRTGGPSSLELVPNLATTLPRPTNGGRTYTFEVRRGIRYSTGETVVPSDFVRAIERALTLRVSPTDVLMPIVGANRCVRTPDRCDLSAGVVADDDRSTITFHLRAPDPEFIYALSQTNTAPVPEGTPMRTIEHVPSTGAYMIGTFAADERVTLRRNPHFRSWSPVARPEGFVDEIEWRFGVPTEDGIELVKDGRADWIGGVVGPTLPLDALRTRHASQVHINPVAATYSMFLNTRVAPFDDIRARRALNLAVDRARLVRAMGGIEYAAPTCQVQPPNLPNYEPYCPYARGSAAAGLAPRPDLAEAERLIDASGTRGMRIEVHAFAPLFGAAGRYFESLLDRLGYDVTLRIDRDPSRYFAAIADPANEIQIGAVGWFLGLPTPSGMFTPYTCGAFHRDPTSNMNHSGFCSGLVDRLYERARELQAIDPEAAAALWGRLERAVVDAAPLVPFANPNAVDFVSERLGNYRSSPTLGLLLDQVWVT